METLEDWNKKLQIELLPITVIIILYLIFGVIGNIVVVVLHKLRMKSLGEHRYFIPYLAVVDCLSCIFNCILQIIKQTIPVKFYSAAACKVMYFTCTAITLMSVFMLVAIGIQRYLAICRPFGRQMTLKRRRIAMVSLTLIALLSSWPTSFFYSTQPVQKEGNNSNITGCHCINIRGPWTKTERFIYQAFLFLLTTSSVISLIVFYSLIGRTVYQRIRSRRIRTKTSNVPLGSASGERSAPSATSPTSTSGEVDHRNKHHHKGLRFTLMLMLITVIFCFCSLTKTIMYLYETSRENFWLELKGAEIGWFRFLYTFYIFNNVINPVIYGFCDKKYSTAMKQTFCSCKSN